MEVNSTKAALYAIVALGCISVAIHLLPFMLYGKNPLGYDTGFYRRYMLQPVVSIPNTPVPGLGSDALVPRLILDTEHVAHIPPDIALYGTYLLFFALMPGLVFLLLRQSLGTRGALLAAAFIILSAVSYNTYWYMLFKNALGLDLILLACILLERRSTLLLIAVEALLALSHETSAIMYMLTLGAFFILGRGKRWDVLAHAALVFVLFLSVNYSFIHQVSVAPPAAVFLDWSSYLRLSVPFLLLIAVGWRAFDRQSSLHVPRTVLALATASFIFPLLQLPFYERIFVYCDIALAIVAAYAAEHLIRTIAAQGISKRMYVPAAAVCIAVGLLGGFLLGQIRELTPLMLQSDIQEIQSIGATVPNNAYILTTSDEAPWYEGWTTSHIIAPGLLHDTHNLEAWTAFWDATSTIERIAFLDTFPKPLYISTLGSFADLIGTTTPCLAKTSEHLLYNGCK